MPYADRQKQLAYMKEYTNNRRAILRNIINKAKSIPCTDCGISYAPHVMQFDHVRGKKLLPIGSVTARIKTTKALIEEMVLKIGVTERSVVRLLRPPPMLSRYWSQVT